jgi:iron complex transport system substrate-binding protein
MIVRRIVRSAVLAGCVAAGGARAAASTSDVAGIRLVPYSPTLAAMAFEMGLGDRVVGVTRWARLPRGQVRPVVGDAVSVDVEALLAVRPEIVAVQGERIAGFDALARIAPAVRVETIRIERLEDIAPAARRLAALAGGGGAAEAAVTRFERTVSDLRAARAPDVRPRVLFVLGTTRPTVAGPETFLADLIRLCGGLNAGDDIPGRVLWRPADLESIARASPDVLICQVGDGEAAGAARAWWLARTLVSAARTGRIFVVEEPEWTIPSLSIAGFAQRLRTMIAEPGDAPPGPPRP